MEEVRPTGKLSQRKRQRAQRNETIMALNRLGSMGPPLRRTEANRTPSSAALSVLTVIVKLAYRLRRHLCGVAPGDLVDERELAF